jgi:hypothetical protein
MLAAVLGTAGCVKPSPATDAGVCIALAGDVAALRRGLEENPQTPDAVGEPGADVVIGFEAGCR